MPLQALPSLHTQPHFFRPFIPCVPAALNDMVFPGSSLFHGVECSLKVCLLLGMPIPTDLEHFYLVIT